MFVRADKSGYNRHTMHSLKEVGDVFIGFLKIDFRGKIIGISAYQLGSIHLDAVQSGIAQCTCYDETGKTFAIGYQLSQRFVG